LEFYRAVLERGRTLAFEDPDHAIIALQELLDGLDALRNPDFDDSAVQDLLVVALVILARAHLERLNHVACEEYLKRARMELRKSSGNRETEASLLETWAALARAQGNTTLALTRLKQAERLLEGCDVQQRYSEVLARQGLLLVQNGFASQGFTVLGQAYQSLPNPSYPRLRLEIRHFQIVAAVQLQKFDQALHYLSSAKTLYDIYASLEPMATQRLWLLGFSYLAKGALGKAEKPLREALERYQVLGKWDGAAHAMAGLAVLYASQKEPKAVSALVEEYAHVMDSASGLKLAVLGLRKALQLANALEIPAPQLKSELGWLELEDSGRKAS